MTATTVYHTVTLSKGIIVMIILEISLDTVGVCLEHIFLHDFSVPISRFLYQFLSLPCQTLEFSVYRMLSFGL